jgi:hypothetical protein
LKKFTTEAGVSDRHAVMLFLQRLLLSVPGFAKKRPDDVVGANRSGEGQESRDSGLGKVVSNSREFDIGMLLRPSSFLYILAGMGIILFQTYNNLTINNLALKNEKLREQLQMTSSVITSQELKMHELHSIRNIAQDAAVLGVVASSIPPVELEP